MKNQKAKEATVRRSKRNQGEDASPLELPVRKCRRAKLGTEMTNQDQMVVNQDKVLEDQILEEAAEDFDEGDGTTDKEMDQEEVERGTDPEEHYTENQNGEKEIASEEADKQTENSTQTDQTKQPDNKIRRKRGPTKMRKLAKEAMEKVNVEFSVIGEHSGPGSVTLSSFLGPLVREHVPVLVDDWRSVDCATKDTMWEEIKARFNLQEGWQRECVFKQMGSIWRASKPRVVSKLRETQGANQRLKLKPSNIHSLASWNNWVKSRTCTAFKVKSDQYRDLRKSQIPHTTSRKGMFRLSMEMSSDPKKVTRSKVWLAGHTHTDGRPVKKEFAEKIERIRSIDSEMDSTSTENVREDAVSQVLGKDRYGRVRGMGRGISLNKLDYLSARDSHVQKLEASQAEMMNKIEELQTQVRGLAGKNPSSAEVDAQSNISNTSKGGIKCRILDWCLEEDVIDGEGEVFSTDHRYMIDGIPLGPNAVAVLVKSATNPTAYVWRPTTKLHLIGEAVGAQIPWQADKVDLESGYSSPNGHKPAAPEASDEVQTKCNIFSWNGSDIVAEGIICSVDPTEKVNTIPLGPNAAIMKITKVIDPDAFLWRPTAEMAVMSDAENQTIAWRLDKVEFIEKSAQVSPHVSQKTSPGSTSKSTGSSNSAKKRCLLFDCSGSGKIVAEGRVFSTDPTDRVHFIPLGPNASKVWIDVSKIGDAKVWRPNSEIECVDDARGTTVAWPNEKLKIL